MKLIAQDKKKELSSEREKVKKAEEEAMLLKGTNESLNSRVSEMERRLIAAEEQVKKIQAQAEVEAKDRVYYKFLAGTLSREVIERRLRYWDQLSEMTGVPIPDPKEDSDSEKEEEEKEEKGGERGGGEDEQEKEKEPSALTVVVEEGATASDAGPSNPIVPSSEGSMPNNMMLRGWF